MAPNTRRPRPRPIDTTRRISSDLRRSLNFMPRRSTAPLSPYRDDASPLSPVSPAILGTARIWTPSPGLTPRIVEISQSTAPHSACPNGGHGRHERDMSPQSLLAQRGRTMRKDGWVRYRSKPSPLYPFGLRSPTFQCLICGIIFIASLTAFLTLKQASDMAVSLQATFIILIVLSAILLLHSILRMCTRSSSYLTASGSHHLGAVKHQNHAHRQRRRHLEPRYREPASPFDQLPPDDSLYSPITPLRVHVLRDEEALVGEKADDEEDSPLPSALAPVPPPPAYGMWRCSVRADPNLLHWEHADGGRVMSTPMSSPALEMVQRPHARNALGEAPRRPPSYHSERGDELREDDTGVSMEPGVFVQAVEDDMQIRRQSTAVEETLRMLREERRA